MPDPVAGQHEDNNGKQLGGCTGKGFMPGQSGNPSGGPKGRSLTARLRALLEKGEINGKPIPGGKQVADLVVEGLLKGAIKGDVRHQTEVWNRVEGKVPDRLVADVTNHDPERDRSDVAELLVALGHRRGMPEAQGYPRAGQPGGPGGDGVGRAMDDGATPGRAE